MYTPTVWPLHNKMSFLVVRSFPCLKISSLSSVWWSFWISSSLLASNIATVPKIWDPKKCYRRDDHFRLTDTNENWLFYYRCCIYCASPKINSHHCCYVYLTPPPHIYSYNLLTTNCHHCYCIYHSFPFFAHSPYYIHTHSLLLRQEIFINAVMFT
jgi:hypothetical protein